MRGGLVGAKPKGKSAGLAWIIRRRTLGGEELIQFMLDVLRRQGEFRGRAVPLKLRMEAAAWLADHGWGKPEGLTKLLAERDRRDASGVVFIVAEPREPLPTAGSPAGETIEGTVVVKEDGGGGG